MITGMPREAGIGLDVVEDGEPVELGHQDVEQDHVRQFGLEQPERRAAVLCGRDGVALCLEAPLQQHPVEPVVVDDHDVPACGAVARRDRHVTSSAICGRARAHSRSTSAASATCIVQQLVLGRLLEPPARIRESESPEGHRIALQRVGGSAHECRVAFGEPAGDLAEALRGVFEKRDDDLAERLRIVADQFPQRVDGRRVEGRVSPIGHLSLRHRNPSPQFADRREPTVRRR